MNEFKKKSDSVILTTAFNIALPIARQYFRSLDRQTEKAFDIFIVNDGFEHMPLIRKEFPQLHIIEVAGVGIIAKNREIMINMTREVYEKAIFCDFDDFFTVNRVAVSLMLLDSHDIVVNDIDILLGGDVIDSAVFSQHLNNGQELVLDTILECNFFGMSNTGVRLRTVPKVTFDNSLRAVDWYFFSLLLLNGATAIFNNQMQTVYRQHDSNIANIKNNDLTQLLNELDVKKTHYRMLSCFDCCYSDLYEKVIIFSENIENESSKKYIVNVDAYDSPVSAWWSLVNFNIKWINNENN